MIPNNITASFFRRITIVIALTFFINYGFAWGVLGHRIVGEIAYTYLTPKAKKNIALLLGNESIAMSSNWADFIKSDPQYNYLYNWHFLNVPPSLKEAEFMKYISNDTAVNAYTKIMFLEKELDNKVTDKATKAMYLKLLIHIVGDIHQPLHLGHVDDKGGNTIKVTWFNEPSNIHQVWDEKLINFQQLSYTEYVRVINFSKASERDAWQKQPLSEWLYESYQLADLVYKDIQMDEKLSYTYNFRYITILNQQLLKGGVRLAGILNEVFD